MKKILLYLFIFLLVFLVRIPGLTSFSTVDEPDYIKYGGNFYYSLGQRDFERTNQTYQPAVTTLYASALAFHYVFPEYRGFSPAYFDHTDQQTNFLEEKGVEPLTLLLTARLIMILMVSIMLTITFAFLDMLLGSLPAFVVISLISFEPYFLGHSRLLTQEGLMAIAGITSILGIIVYCIRKDKWIFLVISSLAAAIAVLTKITAIVLLPVVFFFLIFISSDSSSRRKRTWQRLFEVMVWSIIFIVFALAVWPALWNHPLETIIALFEKSFGFLGSKAGVPIENLSFQGIVGGMTIFNYIKYLWWQVPPLTWAGFLLILVLVIFRYKMLDRSTRVIFFSFLALGLLMILMMSFGKKVASHYIMISHTSLNLLAGLGLSGLYEILLKQHFKFPAALITYPAVLLMAGSLVAPLIGFYPYYFDYLNPIARAVNGNAAIPDNGYGQGLDIAARYLAEKADSANLTVMSWWSTSLDYFFPGETKQIAITRNWTPSEAGNLKECDYLVIYQRTQAERRIPEALMTILKNVVPEKSIFLHGLEMVRIYKVSDLPLEVFSPVMVEP